jgi:hypothetical protein
MEEAHDGRFKDLLLNPSQSILVDWRLLRK